jgi:hypothetical protein
MAFLVSLFFHLGQQLGTRHYHPIASDARIVAYMGYDSFKKMAK